MEMIETPGGHAPANEEVERASPPQRIPSAGGDPIASRWLPYEIRAGSIFCELNDQDYNAAVPRYDFVRLN